MKRTTNAERAARRISQWVTDQHEGNFKAAAAQLKVDYTSFWRTARGHSERGPSSEIVAALLDAAGKTFAHWTGRSA